MTSSNPRRPPFSLQFRVYSDGLASELPSYHNSFPQFRLLPPELRLKVWEYLLVPRILAVSCHPSDGSLSSPQATPDQYQYQYQSYFSTLGLQLPQDRDRPCCPLVPVLLHINRETRHLALKHYELAFGWKVPYQLLCNSHSDPHDRLMEWTEPRIYFDFSQDALFLRDELELYDDFGFNSPMTYFMRKEDTLRVRKVALAFGALRYGETGSQQIFGALFHVVDRFAPVDGRVLVCVTDGDEYTHCLMGGEHPLVEGIYTHTHAHLNRRMADAGARARRDRDRENVVQKVWREWYRGSTIRSKLVNMEFKLIREAELEEYVGDEERRAQTDDIL